MRVAKNMVVAIDYILRDDEGIIMDKSDGEPLVYLHGHGQLVPGLEKALEGKGGGDDVKVVVDPVDGYGERSSEEVMRVPLTEFPEGAEPEVGMEIEMQADDDNLVTMWIVDVDSESVTMSADHPFAGIALHFEVKVLEVRAATPDELAHGHAHGPDDHHH